jgi:hypothetical protein
MGSLVLFALGVAAPLVVALVVMAREERRRAYVRMRFERVSQDNRGLKLALSSGSSSRGSLNLPANADPREVGRLIDQLAQKGILLDWLRLGVKSRAEAGMNDHYAAALEQAIADWGAHGVVAALDRLKGRLAAIAEMEMIWADPHTHLAHDQGEMLGRTMWVFEPEYVMREGQFAVDPRIGAVAKPSVGAGLAPGQSKDGEPTLVVELKSARTTVGADQQLHAWNNVRELMRGGAVRERDPVEVFVVGGGVDELDGNPRIEGRYRNVRITSYDYSQLIARAKRLTFGLYDELKDAAPFLRQHREQIAAAEQAAVDQAAAEASVPQEDEPVREADQADGVRHEEYAAAPSRGAYERPHGAHEPPPQDNPYEGEHIVIGRRRHAH